MNEEQMRNQVQQSILELIENLKKYESFILTFTPIHKMAGTSPSEYFADSMSIASISSADTSCIAVSMGHHFGKSLLAAEFLANIAEDMGVLDKYKQGFDLGQECAERGAEPDAYVRYKETKDTDELDTDND